MNRGFWFVAGASAGVYAAARARRVAEAFTPEGMVDRLGALALGARLLREDVLTGMAEKESELRARVDPALALPPGGADEAPPTRVLAAARA